MNNSWINLTAVLQILVFGLILGAGVPALFAVGLRALAIGGKPIAATDGGETEESGGLSIGRTPLGLTLAGLCFLIVLAAIAYGIYFIVAGGH